MSQYVKAPFSVILSNVISVPNSWVWTPQPALLPCTIPYTWPWTAHDMLSPGAHFTVTSVRRTECPAPTINVLIFSALNPIVIIQELLQIHVCLRYYKTPKQQVAQSLQWLYYKVDERRIRTCERTVVENMSRHSRKGWRGEDLKLTRHVHLIGNVKNWWSLTSICALFLSRVVTERSAVTRDHSIEM